MPAPTGLPVNPIAQTKALASQFYPTISRFRVGVLLLPGLLLGLGSVLALGVFRQWDLPLGEQVTQLPAPSSEAAGSSKDLADVEPKSSGPTYSAQAVNSVNVIPAGTPRFGILVNRHSTAASAEDTLLLARMENLGPTQIFRRRDLGGATWYWVVTLFSDRATAEARLRTVRETLDRSGAYVMDINLWCATQKTLDQDVVECATSRDNIPG